MRPIYTTILHEVRQALDLSLIEYCILDSIDKLSNRPEFPWCEVTRPKLAEFFGVEVTTVKRALKSFEEKGLIEIEPETRCVRTTLRWHEAVNLGGGGAKCTDEGVQNAPLGGAKCTDTIYIDNNIDKGASLRSADPDDEDVRYVQTDEDGNEILPRKKPKAQLPANIALKASKWSQDESLARLRESTHEADKILAFVWDRKGYDFRNYSIFKTTYNREIKEARKLVGYSKSEVKTAIELAEKEAEKLDYEWGISTVVKKIQAKR